MLFVGHTTMCPKGTNMKKTKKTVDKPLKHKGKSYTVKELARELNVGGKIEITTKKSWFSEAMDELDKEEKK